MRRSAPAFSLLVVACILYAGSAHLTATWPYGGDYFAGTGGSYESTSWGLSVTIWDPHCNYPCEGQQYI